MGSGDRDEFFNPLAADGVRPICICGFELIKEDNDVFRCTGGSHRYRMSEGEVTYDKYGMPLMKIPKEEENGKEKKN